MRNAKQLAEQHTDPVWRERFVRATDLLDLLADSVIDSNYAIPDDLNASITLTPAGNHIFDSLHRKEQVPVKEARLMTALTLGHEELFIDVIKSDLDKMQAAIESQLQRSTLQYPLVLGRDLYDAYAALFEDERDELNLEDTLRLLKKTPKGVYQYGRLVIGPLGILTSRSNRSIRASRSVPAFHCAQPSCRVVHRAHLTTSQSAPVNAFRSKIHELLDASRKQASEWWSLPAEFSGLLDSYFDDTRAAPLVALIGDCLDDRELRLLVCDSLDKTRGEVRALLPSNLSGKAEEIADGLSRNELIQLALLASEHDLVKGLDRLVRAELIHVAPGDIRSPVVNEARRSGAFGLRAELGSRGVRFVSDDPGLPALRLRRLLRKLYLRDNAADSEELEWQLRGFDAEDLDERLEDFYQSMTPREALRRMVLVRKTNLIMASHEVDVEDIDTLTDDEIVETVLWKLGFSLPLEEDRHAYFWDLHQRLTALTRSSRISGSGESERFRGVANTFFTELEGLLIDSLAFSAWMLTTDHTSASFSFEYDDEADRALGLSALQAAHERQTDGSEQFDYVSDKVELFALLRGFAILGSEMEQLSREAQNFMRLESEYPTFDGKTDLKSFVFRHTVPFLDLTPASQDRIKATLKEISRNLIANEVHQVRNDYSHYRRNAKDISAMTEALDAVGSAIHELENLGFARILCQPTEVTSDPWGRSQHGFAGPRSVTHLFARPSNYDWMGLPSLSASQYIVHGAVFAEPNEVLRFRRRYDSAFSRMWSDYPRRRVAGSEAMSPSSALEDVETVGPAPEHR